MRTKFKKCVSECKQAALTLKTATGIKRFQEERGFGKWFNALFALVQSRDSCKPELALEPSSLEKATDEASKNDGKEGLFIPVRKRQKVKANDKLGEMAIEAMNVVKESFKNDPTNDLIAFMREEMEKSREHELKLVGLKQSFRQNNAPIQVPQQMASSIPYPGGSSVPTTSYPIWNIAIGGHNQPAAYQNSEVACTSIRQSQPSETSPAGIHYDGQKP